MKKLFTVFLFLLTTIFYSEVVAQTFTPESGKFYVLTQQASGFVLGRSPGTYAENDNGMRGVLRTPNTDERREQSYKFVPTDVPGQYYLVNGLGEYVWNENWRLRHHASITQPDPPVEGVLNGYRFTVSPSELTPGMFHIGTVSHGTVTPKVFGSDNTTLGAFVNADETVAENGTRADWSITPSTLTAVRDELSVKVLSYPNPFVETAVVEVPGKFAYSLLDVNGKELLEGNGVNQVSLGDHLKQGIYFLKVQQGSSSRTIRLMKL